MLKSGKAYNQKRLLFLLICFLVVLNRGKLALGNNHIILNNFTKKIISLSQNKEIDINELTHDLKETKVIFLGETHNQIYHHVAEKRLLELLYNNTKGKVILALEMVERRYQDILDRWVAGKISKKELLESIGWEDNWGYPFPLYEGLFTYAKEHKIRILALNAPRKIVEKVGKKGLRSLSQKERKLIARMIQPGPSEHKKYLKKIFEEHAKREKNIKEFKFFYEAQLVWEETMAETLARDILSHKGGCQYLVITGSGHINYYFGIPLRLHRRVPVTYKTIILRAIKGKEYNYDIFGDFIWYTKYLTPKPPHPRLGLLLIKDSNNHLKVEKVIKNSRAEKAGFKKGDILIKVNDREIEKVMDIHRGIVSHPEKKLHIFRVRREGKEIIIKVRFDKK